MRFGPGVMTHSHKHQEVGFWIGNRLLRLSYNLKMEIVPSYDVKNIYTRIKLLQFKHLVNITQVC